MMMLSHPQMGTTSPWDQWKRVCVQALHEHKHLIPTVESKSKQLTRLIPIGTAERMSTGTASIHRFPQSA